MTFTASFNGPSDHFPGVTDLVRPPVEQLSPDAVEHVRHIGHIVQRWMAENEGCEISLSLNGYQQPTENGEVRQFSLAITTTSRAQAPAQEEDPVDASKSPDPFAPDTPSEADPTQPAENESSAGSDMTVAETPSSSETPQAVQEPAPDGAAGEVEVSAPAQDPALTEAQEASAQDLAPPNTEPGVDGPGDPNPEVFPEPDPAAGLGAPAPNAAPAAGEVQPQGGDPVRETKVQPQEEQVPSETQEPSSGTQTEPGSVPSQEGVSPAAPAEASEQGGEA